MITQGRLLEIIAAYGADPRRWPEAERSEAEALLARSEPARAALAEARALDGLLDGLPALAPEIAASTLAARAIAAGQRPLARPARGGWLWLAPSAAGLAAAALAGFFIGWAEVDAAVAADRDSDFSGYVASLDIDGDLL